MVEKNLEQELISCIITCYNQKKFVKDAIESVLKQTYKNIELIIIDDGSTDSGPEIINGYRSNKRVSIIFHEKNKGLPSIARNTGIKIIKGEYIAFLDADDYWVENKLEKQIKFFDSENVVGVGSTLHKIGNLNMQRPNTEPKKNTLDFNTIFSSSNVALSSLIVRNTGKLFNECEKYRFVEDFHYQLKLTENGKLINVVNEPLVHYRIHSGGGSINTDYLENVINVLDEFKDKVDSLLFKKVLSRAYLGIGYKCIRNSYRGSLRYAVKSILNYPFILKSYLLFLLSFLPNKINKIILLKYYKKL